MASRRRRPGRIGLVAIGAVIVLAAAGSAVLPVAGPPERGILITRVEIRVGPYPAPAVPSPARPAPAGQAPARPRRVPVAGCHPLGTPAVAAVDPVVASRVDRAWQAIERWLARHAPASYASLRPPASPAAIARTQAVLGRRLPAELVASLRRHDGVTIDRGGAFALPPFYTPMTTTQIAADWTVNCDVIQSLGQPPDPRWWSPAYTPFAAAGDGGSLVLDQRPGARPQVGEFFAEDGTDFTRWPASLTDLLQITAQTLHTGHAWNDYRPAVHAAALDWDILN